jgi:hypothetical protein
LVTELIAFTQFNKLFAVFCNPDVAHKNFSGLFIIFATKDAVLELFSTLIFQISFSISLFCCNEIQNSKV